MVLTIPKLLGIIETLANGHSAVSTIRRNTQHVFSKIVDSLLMNVVRNDQPGFVGWLPRSQGVVEDVFGNLDGIGTVMAVVTRVEIVQNDMITELAQVFQTSGLRKTTRVRRTHVGREGTQNVPKSHFVLVDLFHALFVRDLAEILMGPGVTGNLVTTALHTPDQVPPVVIRVINGALAAVVASDEKSRLGTVLVQQIE